MIPSSDHLIPMIRTWSQSMNPPITASRPLFQSFPNGVSRWARWGRIPRGADGSPSVAPPRKAYKAPIKFQVIKKHFSIVYTSKVLKNQLQFNTGRGRRLRRVNSIKPFHAFFHGRVSGTSKPFSEELWQNARAVELGLGASFSSWNGLMPVEERSREHCSKVPGILSFQALFLTLTRLAGDCRVFGKLRRMADSLSLLLLINYQQAPQRLSSAKREFSYSRAG